MILLVYSVLRVGELTIWSMKASLTTERSCEHWGALSAYGTVHSISQSISAGLKSPPNHRCGETKLTKEGETTWTSPIQLQL